MSCLNLFFDSTTASTCRHMSTHVLAYGSSSCICVCEHGRVWWGWARSCLSLSGVMCLHYIACCLGLSEHACVCWVAMVLSLCASARDLIIQSDSWVPPNWREKCAPISERFWNQIENYFGCVWFLKAYPFWLFQFPSNDKKIRIVGGLPLPPRQRRIHYRLQNRKRLWTSLRTTAVDCCFVVVEHSWCKTARVRIHGLWCV